MVSVSGIRGIVGRSLTVPVLVEYASAFGLGLGRGPAVVGRDARRSGPWVFDAVAAALAGVGTDVVDIGLVTTPAAQVAVLELGAAGGIMISASHNPEPWNALKLLDARGEFLAPDASREFLARVGRDVRWAEHDSLGRRSTWPAAIQRQVERALAHPDLEPDRWPRAPRVVVDGCRSTGGLATPRALRAAGAVVDELDCEPDGRFTRGLEPVADHLGTLRRRVRETGADFGIAHDPDADRTALVGADGTALGEELTLALAAQVVLARRKGPLVTNLSTSRMIEDLAAAAGVPCVRTPVGEAHVVAGMRAHGAILGGEGNGGVIAPEAHLGRDGTVAALLAVQAWADHGGDLARAVKSLPRYVMIKDRLTGADWPALSQDLRRVFAGLVPDETDGLRFTDGRSWIHIRPSGTEPIVRLIAEGPDRAAAEDLVRRARIALAA